MKSVYLDNAATTPLDKDVLEAMTPYFSDYYGNASSTHHFGKKAKAAMETARRSIAKGLNCTPGEIFFTGGGSEADNMAINGAVRDLGCKHIITSQIEHPAVLKTAEHYEGGVSTHYVRLLDKGHIDLSHLEELLTQYPNSLVSLMHANNEIANLLALKEVGEMCKKHDALFHCDTVQAMGRYVYDLKDTHVHFITCAAHKFHGPNGVGFLYVRKGTTIKATTLGGGQERGLRAGTENVPGIVGLAKAFDLCYDNLEEHQAHVSSIKQYMIQELEKHISGVDFNGDSKSEGSLYTVLNITLPESENASMITVLLDLEGIACSGGSACSSGATKGSRILEAIGAIKENRASIRFSFSKFTTKKEIDYCINHLKEILSQ